MKYMYMCFIRAIQVTATPLEIVCHDYKTRVLYTRITSQPRPESQHVKIFSYLGDHCVTLELDFYAHDQYQFAQLPGMFTSQNSYII